MKPISDHIYGYVVSSDAGWQKIGLSTNPHLRLKSLESEYRKDNVKLRLIYCTRIPWDSALVVENCVHFLLRAKHIGRERFSVSPEVAVETLRRSLPYVETLSFTVEMAEIYRIAAHRGTPKATKGFYHQWRRNVISADALVHVYPDLVVE
jgi:hypothetical protein